MVRMKFSRVVSAKRPFSSSLLEKATACTRKSIVPHLLLDRVENRVDRGDVLDVAGHDQSRADRFGERLHALGQRVALIGEGELGAVRGQRLGDAPGDGVVVGDPHHQPAFSLHQSRHWPLLCHRPRKRTIQ